MKNRSFSLRRRRLGSTTVEVLVASVILMVSCAGVVSMWSVAYSLTHQADYAGVAYTVGRHALENIKQTDYHSTGLQLSSDGTTTRYYDAAGTDTTSATSGHLLSVQTQLTTANGLQTAIITVTDVAQGSLLYQTSTYLVKAGI